MKKLKYQIILLFITVIWGTSFLFIKGSLTSLNAIEFLAIRFLIAGLIIFPFFITRIKKVKKKDFYGGIILGFILYLVLLLTNISLNFLSASKVAIYTGMSVIITAMLDSLIYKRLNKFLLLSILFSIFGLILVLDISDFKIEFGDIIGIILSFSIAFQLIVAEKVTKLGNSYIMGIIQIYFGMLFSILTLFLFFNGFKNIEMVSFFQDKMLIFSLFYIGGLGTALAFILQTICIKKLSSVEVAIIFNFEPIVGVFFPVIMSNFFSFGNEIVNFFQIIGFVFVIISIFIVALKNNNFKNIQEC